MNGEKELNLEQQSDNGENTEAFRQELEKQGFAMWDGDKIAKEGLNLLTQTPQRQNIMELLATIRQASEIYKEDKQKALLLDQLGRTVFDSHKEMLAFLNYVEWCIEFEVPLDNALRYIVGKTSESGLARSQLLAALTSFNHIQRHYDYGYQKRKPQQNKADLVP